jgi:hypothetical protein
MRELLELLGLKAFCKTTGGKGLHVVTPLAKVKNSPDWPRAKKFAHDVCAAMAADDPERFVLNMARRNAPAASSSILCATTGWRRQWPRFLRALARTRWSRCL